MQLYAIHMTDSPPISGRISTGDRAAVDRLIEAGCFSSDSDAVRSAIRLLVGVYEEHEGRRGGAHLLPLLKRLSLPRKVMTVEAPAGAKT